MPQSPLLSASATPAIPITGSSIGSDPTTTGIPGSPTDVETALTELQTEIGLISSTAGQAPTLIVAGTTYTVADNRQAPYTTPIVVDGVLSIGANARFPEVN